jgi:hypothetical protein
MSSFNINEYSNIREKEMAMIEVAENPSRGPYIFYVFYHELKSIYDISDKFIILNSVANGGNIDMFKFMLNEITVSQFMELEEKEQKSEMQKVIKTIIDKSNKDLLNELFKFLNESNININDYLINSYTFTVKENMSTESKTP